MAVISVWCVPAVVVAQQPKPCSPEQVSPGAFRRILNTQFATVVNPQTGSNIGTFGAYEAKDGTISFAGSTIRDAGSIITLKVTGKGANGILPVIDAESVNSTFSGEVQYHRISPRAQQIRYLLESCELYRAAVAAADRREALANRGFVGTRSRLAVSVRLREYAERRKLIEDLKKTVDSLSQARLLAPSPVRVSWIDARIAELRLRSDSVSAEVDASRGREAQDVLLQAGAVAAVDQLAARNERNAAVTSAEAALKLTGFGFSWWTIAIGVRNNSFTQFTATSAFDSQLVKRKYVSREVRFERSWVRSTMLGRAQSRFFNVGASAAIGDNFASLSPVALTEVQQYGPVTDRRSSSTTIKAVTGSYKTGLETGRLYANAYLFARDGNTLGFHAFPELQFQKGSRGRLSFGTGVLLLAKHPTTQATFVNVEPYWLLVDLWNTRNTIGSVITASQFGFRFTLPLAFQPPSVP